jgi:hypothetical protein
MKYSIHGPFEIKTKKGTDLVDHSNTAKHAFWAIVENEQALLASSCGCYLFAIRASKGIKPWYVGLAAKQPFEKECFTPQKITIYNDALAGKKGTPVLFLISKRSKGGKLAKPSKNGHHDATYLETLLIGAAIKKNPALMNIKKTKYLKQMCVPCLMNTPKRKPTLSEREFKKAVR